MVIFEELNVTYGESVRALRNVNLQIRSGEVTVLLGHSGAGKSTLLRTINRLVFPTSGRVLTGGRELTSRTELQHFRRGTGMIFQSHQLIGRNSALRNVLLGRIGYLGLLKSFLPASRENVNLALHCLERVGLLEKANVRADQLSGGERQRVGIARVLCQRPTLILADEPVASLDPVASENVLGILRRVCKEDGLTAVVSLHQVEYARRFGERIIGMADGEVVFDGGPDQLTDRDLARIYRSEHTEPTHSVERKPVSVGV